MKKRTIFGYAAALLGFLFMACSTPYTGNKGPEPETLVLATSEGAAGLLSLTPGTAPAREPGDAETVKTYTYTLTAAGAVKSSGTVMVTVPELLTAPAAVSV
jgi:hypothetical protein